MKYLYLIPFLLLSALLLGQNTVEQQLQKILGQKSFQHASVGISVYDYAADKILVDINGDKSLIPASTVKILTTLTALKQLGGEYRYHTKLSYSGKIENGILKGDLYIIGSGDPTLGSTKLGVLTAQKLVAEIANQVKFACIEEIDGMVIADESVFDSFPISPSWQWNDIGNYYASGAWGINVNENRYSIIFSNRTTVGHRPKMAGTNPRIPGLNISNEIVLDSAGTGDQAYVFGGPYNFDKRVVGAIPVGKGNFSIKGSIPNPPLFLAQMVAKKLEKKGIPNYGASTQFRKQKIKRKSIYDILSPPMSKIIRQCNFESNNLYCESIFKTMAYDKYKEGAGSYGIRMVERRLRKFNINTSSLHLEDGSGLSNRNLASPSLMASFLGKNVVEMGLDSITQYIPRIGAQGTVRGMSVKGKAWAKSGSMTGILNYVGILKTKKGKYVTFSIMVNHFSIKQKRMRRKIINLLNTIYNGL